MIYLILDTNTWIYLASGLDIYTSKHYENQHFKILEEISALLDKGDITLLVNDIILLERERNKVHSLAKVQKLEKRLASADEEFKDVIKHTGDTGRLTMEEYKKGLRKEIEENKKHIGAVDTLLNTMCLHIPVSQNVINTAFQLSIEKKAPFHNSKNNLADASILLSTYEYLQAYPSNSVGVFVSNNIEDFTDMKDKKKFHPEIQAMIGDVNLIFKRGLNEALKISNDILTELQEFYHFIREAGEKAIKIFTWDIEKRENHHFMYLDVIYFNRMAKDDDALTIAVAVKEESSRPASMAFILPKNLDTTRGINLTFSETLLDIDENAVAFCNVPFVNEAEDTYTARALEGYAKNAAGEMVDLFEEFRQHGHVLVDYWNVEGTKQSISVPLFGFRNQYLQWSN